MLVVSEFVGCSPSLSGAIRVNPWNVDSVADGIYSAIKMPLHDRHLRHAKHWKYVSSHTAAFWVKVSPAYTPGIHPSEMLCTNTDRLAAFPDCRSLCCPLWFAV